MACAFHPGSLVNVLLVPHVVIHRAILLEYSSLESYKSGKIRITEAISVTGHKIPAENLLKKRCKSSSRSNHPGLQELREGSHDTGNRTNMLSK